MKKDKQICFQMALFKLLSCHPPTQNSVLLIWLTGASLCHSQPLNSVAPSKWLLGSLWFLSEVSFLLKHWVLIDSLFLAASISWLLIQLCSLGSEHKHLDIILYPFPNLCIFTTLCLWNNLKSNHFIQSNSKNSQFHGNGKAIVSSLKQFLLSV